MAWTQAQRDKLAKAVATGHTEVRFGDRTIKYRTQSEMIALLNRIDTELAGTRSPNRVLTSFDKGLAK